MEIPNDDFTPEDFEPGAHLIDADLSEADLFQADLFRMSLVDADLARADLSEANLSEAHLRSADLLEAILVDADLSKAVLALANRSETILTGSNISEADLSEADLSGAVLVGVDLSEANLIEADLSGANLRRADLAGADLRRADLSEAVLTDADLSGANLLEANLSGVALSRGTQIKLGLAEIDRMDFAWSRDRVGFDSSESESSDPVRKWDAVARTYHELKTAYSTNGLVGRARKYHVRERRARAKEARATNTPQGTLAWLGSYFSYALTGYGVQLRWPIGIMLMLYFGATMVYWQAGVENSLYYSIVTFTTSPPNPPPAGLVTGTTAMIQTFGGTLLIVLLGYVLGNREQ